MFHIITVCPWIPITGILTTPCCLFAPGLGAAARGSVPSTAGCILLCSSPCPKLGQLESFFLFWRSRGWRKCHQARGPEAFGHKPYILHQSHCNLSLYLLPLFLFPTPPLSHFHVFNVLYFMCFVLYSCEMHQLTCTPVVLTV